MSHVITMSHSCHEPRHNNESFLSCATILIRVHPFVLRTNFLHLIWNMDPVAKKIHLYFDIFEMVIDVLKLQQVRCYSTKIYVICQLLISEILLFCYVFEKCISTKFNRSSFVLFQNMQALTLVENEMLELSISYRNILCFLLLLNVSISHIVSTCAYVLGTRLVHEL